MQTSASNRKLTEQPQSVRPALVAVLVVAVVVVAYLPVVRNGLVNWDDDIYVLNNDAVRAADGLRQIWSTTELPEHFPNYPLVFTSYWIEYRLWGTAPTGYHVTNVLLHAVNTALVFALVLALGGSPWAAGVTAALFGLHPMQVESVAWVTERKNVLSTFFALLTLLAYVRHAQSGRRSAYILAVVAFICALLSKTAVVVLP
ncbi:MAG: tetratricopeptide repeat protein, partial [Gaiellaceae bacterium]